MKKCFIYILCSFAILLLAGCGSGTLADTTENVSTTQSPDTSDSEQTSDTSPQTTTVYDIGDFLREQKLVSGKVINKMAEFIGAEKGIGFADSGVEIYEYKKSSKEYKQLLRGKTVGIEGIEGYDVKAAAINDRFVLIFSEDPDPAVIHAFKKYNVQ